MNGEAGKTTILIIDDEVQMRRLIGACLERNNYQILEAGTGDAGLDLIIHSPPAIILLDLTLPDMDGMTVLQRLREWSNIPVLVLSARDREVDKVAALDGGANDYLSKPFSTNELLARLRVIQRYHQPSASAPVFNSGHLQVDLAKRAVTVKGQPLKFAPNEYALLRYFVQHAGRVLTHRQLLREMWNSDNVEKTGMLRVYVTYLREKIENTPAKPQLLITVPGVGYRLEILE